MRERKTETIIVRVTKTEKDNLIRGAKKIGHTLSQFVRVLIELGK